MKKSLFLSLMLAVGLSASLPAARADGTTVNALKTQNDLTFTVSSETDFGGTVYYNVDALKNATQDLLEQLGATNVSVDVLGGFPDELAMDPAVHVSFDSLRLAGPHVAGAPELAAWKSVTLQGTDGGFMTQQILQGVESSFEIRNLQGQANDLGSEDSYYFTLNTLFAQ